MFGRLLILIALTACRATDEPTHSEAVPSEATEPPPTITPVQLAEDPWHRPGDCFEIPSPGPRHSPVAMLPIALEAGELLDLEVDEAFDVALSLSRDRETLLRVDLPVDDNAVERLTFIAPTSALYTLYVEALEPEANSTEPTRVQLLALGPPTPEGLSRSRATQLIGMAERSDQRGKRATRLLEAAEAWRLGGDPFRRALALHQAGKLDALSAPHLPRARQSLSAALELFASENDLRYQALTLYWLGKVAGRQDDLSMAIHWSERALDAMERAGNLRERATVANDLAGFHLRRGRVQSATDLYLRALDIWQQLEDTAFEATTRTNLGICYVSRGALRQALDHYRHAVALLEGREDSSEMAFALTRLGDVMLEIEGPTAARPILERSLALRRARGDRRGEAVTLNSLGKVALEEHRPQDALELLRRSQSLLGIEEDPWSEAVVHNTLGRTYERLGQISEAQEAFRQALDQAQAVSHRHAQAEALFGMARLLRQEGELDDARRQIERAIEELEQIRQRTERPDLRATFLAIKKDYYDFLISLLAQLHREEPRAGYDASAFLAAETFRARSLLDTFSQVSVDLERKVDPRVLERLDALRQRLEALRPVPAAIPNTTPHASRNTTTVTTSLGTVEEELEKLRQTEAALSEAYRRYDAWTRPGLLGPDPVRQQLLDEDTLALSFHLGEQQSYLWALERDRMVFRDNLPPRAELEAVALEVFKGLRDSHFQTTELAAQLSARHFAQLVLDPIAGLLGDKRLVISAPGVLEYVPFAALPDPRPTIDEAGETAAQRPALAQRHEVVRLPSLSVLAALRRSWNDREHPQGALAILADPVFGPEDPRLQDSESAAEATDFPPLPRLVHSRQEAEVLVELADGPTFLATGFEASRRTVLEGPLADYRIVHFATHGTFDTELPELSSLVFSRFDSNSQPVEGELRAYEIFTLHLPVDLVVLSACRTALGREIRGEGLVGLARGFLEAGARRVLVSLWDVDDQATAQFMSHFYRALFAGDPPSAALRRAQIALARSEHWSAPHYWAAFVLLGDWR